MKKVTPSGPRQRRFLIPILLLTAASLAGCAGEPEKATVSGKVSGVHPYSKRKQLVAAGTVTFYHEQTKKSFSTPIKPDGTYEVEVYAGKCKIIVESVEPDWDDEEVKPKISRKQWFPLPPSYAVIDSSPFELDVQAGTQTHDIHIPVPVALENEE